jgi:hypothetical protein
MADEKVKCLSGFVARVRDIREEWHIDEHKERIRLTNYTVDGLVSRHRVLIS